MKSITQHLKRVLLIGAALLSFNCNALPQSDGGCTESDGTWTCTGGDIIVIGQPPDSGTGPGPDSFGCRKNPQNCLPTAPPTRPGSASSDGGGAGPGHGTDVKDNEETNLAALRAMDCGELRNTEDLYKAYTDTDKGLIDMHKQSLAEANAMLANAAYSASEIDSLHDLANVSCSTYELKKSQRLNGPKVCSDRPNNKPPICRVAPASRTELEQYQSCSDNRRNLSARLGDQTAWKNRKTEAESRIQSMTANLRSDTAQLAKIRAEIRNKKCTK